jgi:DNA-3-methyladenine glycosylase
MFDTLGCEYFAAEAVTVARDLIGRRLIVADGSVEQSAVIVETEAYRGAGDPASHAAFRPGGRAAMMRAEPGRIYIYTAYGMYPCLNIVCEPEGIPAAVLIRGVWIPGEPKPVLGPGRTTRRLGVTLADHGESGCGSRIAVGAERLSAEIRATPRIGVRRGLDLHWRFVTDEIDWASEWRSAG